MYTHQANNYHPDWLAIRASFGANGVLLHNDDLPALAEYLVHNQARRPPDHLTTEWFTGGTQVAAAAAGLRPAVAFRYNILGESWRRYVLSATKSVCLPKDDGR